MIKTIMFIGAHSGDIEVFAGGTVLKYFDEGYRIIYVITTNNMSGVWTRCPLDGSIRVAKPGSLEMMRLRKSEAVAAALKVAACPVFLDHPQRNYNSREGELKELRYGCGIPEGVAENVPSILTAHENQESRNELKDIILSNNPEWIVTHGVDNEQIEHLATALLAAKSYEDAVSDGYSGGLLLWQEGCWNTGATNNLWDVFVDISGYADRKMELVDMHVSRKVPHYVRERNMDWGKKCGCGYAEIYIIAGHGNSQLLK
ncbi:MAG TPA: PIG-L family deacetylase [bacterium]|nr:PIG-L family deacetylase [bacterium]